MIKTLEGIKRTKKKPWRSKVNPIHVYIQEAFMRGYAQGNADGKRGEATSEKMLNSYKASKPNILASARASLKRQGLK